MLRRSALREAECGFIVAARCPLDIYSGRIKPRRELLKRRALQKILPRLLAREPAEHDQRLRTPAT